jgi:hypothetical protein
VDISIYDCAVLRLTVSVLLDFYDKSLHTELHQEHSMWVCGRHIKTTVFVNLNFVMHLA